MPIMYLEEEKLKSGEIKEYEILNQHFVTVEELSDSSKLNIDQIDSKAAEYIGLSEYYGIRRFSGKVGTIWLDKEMKFPLVVQSKIKELDAIKMYLELAENSSLFSNYQSVFQCWPQMPVIKGVQQPDVTLLQVAVFLKELSQFCQRHLRQGFIRVRQNLTGKVKGKILLGENLRQNILHARADRMVCQFHILSLDTPANRILKAALMRCYRYLAGSEKYPILLQWARQCYSALSDVADTNVTEADFRGIVYSGLMRQYQLPHQYARMIIKRLRTDASGEISEQTTVPYVLDMNRLFEGYVGVLLSKTGIDFTSQKNMSLKGSAFTIEFRPDYHAINEGIVVDAKYKAILDFLTKNTDPDSDKVNFENLNCIVKNAKPSNADVYQVTAYCKLLDSAYSLPNKFKIAILAVPSTDDVVKDWHKDSWLKFDLPKLFLTDQKNDGLTIYVLPCCVPMKRTDK